MMQLPRSHELLNRDESRLLIVDMQERILPVIDSVEVVTLNCERLIRGAQILNVPVTMTEQYPKGLGATVAQLAELVPERAEKVDFSCLNCLDWAATANDEEGRFKIIVAGIESHVCVLQTVLDLLSHGFTVHVPADAVSSRSPQNRDIALNRMQAGGAVITTTESVLFEWCERAGTAEFKTISGLVK